MTDLSDVRQDIRELRGELRDLGKRVADGFTRVDEKRHEQTKWLLSLYGVGVAGLAAMIAHGFKWI